MRRLVIAVDCDDVLTPSADKIVEMYNRQFGTNVSLADSQNSGADWQASPGQIGDRIYDIQLTDEYLRVKPFQDAIEVCRRLAKSHDLHLVTARPGRIMATTIAMLENHFKGIFQEIEHIGIDGNKGEICRNLQADALIDDNIRHLEAAKVCGVESLIWFGDYPWQDSLAPSSHTSRCRDWYEVEREIERVAGQ